MPSICQIIPNTTYLELAAVSISQNRHELISFSRQYHIKQLYLFALNYSTRGLNKRYLDVDTTQAKTSRLLFTTTFIQFSCNSHLTQHNIFTKSLSIFIQLSCNYQLFPGCLNIRLSCNYHLMLMQLSPNSHSIIIQCSCNFHPTLIQLSPNAHATFTQLSFNYHPMLIQLSPNSHSIIT